MSKFDEELGRMSAIVNHLLPHSIFLFDESFAATNERERSEIAPQIMAAGTLNWLKAPLGKPAMEWIFIA